MRAFTDRAKSRTDGEAAIAAALEAGITVLDTARAYGDSERAVGAAIRAASSTRARVVTKGGMHHEGDVWRPDGRAKRLFEDCEASLEALGGVPIDTYLVHAPDTAVPWATTVRALARIHDQKLSKHVGVCNVNRAQLDESLDLAPISVVQVALGPGLDAAIRGGVVARCIERKIMVMAHSPFGGPKRAGRLSRDAVIATIAKRHDRSAHAIALALLLDLHPCIVPIPGATRAATARECASAAAIGLDDVDRATLAERFTHQRMLFPMPALVGDETREVVLVMGLQGSGKSTLAASFVANGYERLNRDERGGTLRGLHQVLAERLANGTASVVLDNTYTTRTQRFDAIAAARAHGTKVRGLWIQTSLADAQVNVIERMLAAHGRLLEPREMERARDPSSLSPLGLFRTARDLEPPGSDEGFSALEVVPFARKPVLRSRAARFVALEAGTTDDDPECVFFAWRPGAARESLSAGVLLCPHDAGPPRCWCRPPLPGLLLAYARANDVDLSRSLVVGTGPAHANMAAAVGARYVERKSQSQRR